MLVLWIAPDMVDLSFDGCACVAPLLRLPLPQSSATRTITNFARATPTRSHEMRICQIFAVAPRSMKERAVVRFKGAKVGSVGGGRRGGKTGRKPE